MAKESRWKEWADQRTSRNQNWTEKETGTLIKVWLKYLDILKLHRRTGKIYEKMAGEFAHYGFKRSAIELQKKVSNLTQEYRKEKTKMKNGQGPSKWKFFDSVQDIVSQLTNRRECVTALSRTSRSRPSESEPDNTDDVKFLAVYLNEQSMSEGEGEYPEPQMPVIVSVESQHPDQKAVVLQPADTKKALENIKTDMHIVLDQIKQPVQRTLVFRPSLQESGSKKVLKDLKTDMHRVLEESLDIHRQQVTLQQRQIVLHEDMLKIMAKFIDNCP